MSVPSISTGTVIRGFVTSVATKVSSRASTHTLREWTDAASSVLTSHEESHQGAVEPSNRTDQQERDSASPFFHVLKWIAGDSGSEAFQGIDRKREWPAFVKELQGLADTYHATASTQILGVATKSLVRGSPMRVTFSRISLRNAAYGGDVISVMFCLFVVVGQNVTDLAKDYQKSMHIQIDQQVIRNAGKPAVNTVEGLLGEIKVSTIEGFVSGEDGSGWLMYKDPKAQLLGVKFFTFYGLFEP